MSRIIPLRCRCGQVQREARAARIYARVSCHCRDCQAYARWLGTPGLLDACGGTDIVAMAPSGLRFTAGSGQIACGTLSGRVYRWYAACCRTPLGNTARNPRVHYVGLCTACLPDAAAVDAAVGPAGSCVVHSASANAPVRATPLAFLWGGLCIAKGVLGARLRGQRESPFFDAATGRPMRESERIGVEN
ncbi:DUF6151 family protein [Luteimonas sp. MC1895]|uniref:DUF6151 family protein n=1 Tax=Luteimonas sp. MC1895 TaxID=2819513 RepID=UPI0018F07D41|nr:DUF6151 family protein [Luteimonas sp. MC1895]MBJ6979417.1 hypothetical protein [Luteimonas sp. MC1895]